jgi:hypothetical protein
MSDLLAVHVAAADRPDQNIVPALPHRERQEHCAASRSRSNRFEPILGSRMLRIGQNSHRPAENVFDFRQCQTVPLAF